MPRSKRPGLAMQVEDLPSWPRKCATSRFVPKTPPSEQKEALIGTSVQLALEGGEVSKTVSEQLNEIVESVNSAADIVKEIAVAGQEQARGVAQLNDAVGQIDRVVQQSAATSEQSASAAEQLSSQSQELASLVGRFRISDSVSLSAAAPLLRPRLPANRPHHAVVDDPEKVIPLADEDQDYADF